MAPPERRPWLLLLVAAAMIALCAAGTSKPKDITGGYFQHDCPMRLRPSSTTTRGTAYSANLRSLLAALPSAAAPTGFASLRSSHGRAFATARGLCFGDYPPPESCSECLTLSAASILDACDGNRSAAVWTDGCFLAYTDDSNTSAIDDGFYVSMAVSGDVSCAAEEVLGLARDLAARAAEGSSSGRMLATADGTCRADGATVHALAQCPSDVAPADCGRCLEKSAGSLPESLYWSGGIPAGAGPALRGGERAGRPGPPSLKGPPW